MAETTKISRLRVWWIVYKNRPWLRWAYLLGRWFHGARRIQSKGYDATKGALSEDGLEVEWGGACPVQGFGTIDGYPCYYRSRGESWSFDIFPPGTDLSVDADLSVDPIWSHEADPYIWPDGGWVSSDVSAACIRNAAALFRAQAGAVRADTAKVAKI